MAGTELGRRAFSSVRSSRPIPRDGGGTCARRPCVSMFLHARRNSGEEGPRERRPPVEIRRNLPEAERQRRMAEGSPHAVRFRVPEAGVTDFKDEVFGQIRIENQELEDFVLLRSDGQPTYHLSVVCDDVKMRITHVIRGADHLSNTPKQILLYRALGAALPVFAHLPLILGPDKQRLSKRHGATSVGAYRDQGILPEALVNFLALLGWTPPGGEEILSREAMVRQFDLSAVSKSNAVFDPEKLAWMNSQYLRALSLDRLVPLVEAELKSAGIDSRI